MAEKVDAPLSKQRRDTFTRSKLMQGANPCLSTIGDFAKSKVKSNTLKFEGQNKP